MQRGDRSSRRGSNETIAEEFPERSRASASSTVGLPPYRPEPMPPIRSSPRFSEIVCEPAPLNRRSGGEPVFSPQRRSDEPPRAWCRTDRSSGSSPAPATVRSPPLFPHQCARAPRRASNISMLSDRSASEPVLDDALGDLAAMRWSRLRPFWGLIRREIKEQALAEGLDCDRLRLHRPRLPGLCAFRVCRLPWAHPSHIDASARRSALSRTRSPPPSR